MSGVGSGRTRECVTSPHILAQTRFELPDLGPHDIPAVVENRPYPFFDSIANAMLLRSQINELHGILLYRLK